MSTTEVKRYYGFADYEEETAFLEQAQLQGKILSDYRNGKYVFEEGSRDAVCYQISLNRDGQADEQFITLYKDYGWDYVMRRDNRFYFRKPANIAGVKGCNAISDMDDLPFYIKTVDDEVNHQLSIMAGIAVAPFLIALLTLSMMTLFQSLLVFALPTLFGALILLPSISRLLNDKKKLMSLFDKVSQNADAEWEQRLSQNISAHKEIYTKKQLFLFSLVGLFVLLAGFALGYVLARGLF